MMMLRYLLIASMLCVGVASTALTAPTLSPYQPTPTLQVHAPELAQAILPAGPYWTEAQKQTLTELYARSGYLPPHEPRPTTIKEDEFARGTISSLVHPDGRLNQPRDPWSQSMVQVFGAPQRKPAYADQRSLQDVIDQGVASVLACDGWPSLSNAVINRLGRQYGPAWRNKYFRALTDASAKAKC